MKILIKDKICTVDFMLDRHHSYYVELDRLIRFSRLCMVGNVHDDVQIIITRQGDQLTIGQGETNMVHIVMNGELTAMNKFCEKLLAKTMQSTMADVLRKIKDAVTYANMFGGSATHESIDAHETDESLQLQKLSDNYLKQIKAKLPDFVEEVNLAVERATAVIEDSVERLAIASRCVDSALIIFSHSSTEIPYVRSYSFYAIRRVFVFGDWKYAAASMSSMSQFGSGVYFCDAEENEMLEFLRARIFNHYRRSFTKNPLLDYSKMVADAITYSAKNDITSTMINYTEDRPLTVEIADFPDKPLSF